MNATSRTAASRRATVGATGKTHLTDAQLEHFRRRILAMRKEIADQVDRLHEQAAADRERAESDLNHLHHVAEINHDVRCFVHGRRKQRYPESRILTPRTQRPP